jgi:cysteinyl-tRNA synthetase
VIELCGALGLALRTEPDEVPADVAALAARRDGARAARDWATADGLRAELEAAGWVVEDTPTGTKVRQGRT